MFIYLFLCFFCFKSTIKKKEMPRKRKPVASPLSNENNIVQPGSLENFNNYPLCKICETYKAKKKCTSCNKEVCLECYSVILLKRVCRGIKDDDVEYCWLKVCNNCVDNGIYVPVIVNGNKYIPKGDSQEECVIS